LKLCKQAALILKGFSSEIGHTGRSYHRAFILEERPTAVLPLLECNVQAGYPIISGSSDYIMCARDDPEQVWKEIVGVIESCP
jgi:hypothetical protein